MRHYLWRLTLVSDPLILAFDIAWLLPLLLIPDANFTLLGKRYVILLGIKAVWVGAALFATVAKVVRMRSRHPFLRAACGWVSVAFWTFVTALLASLSPITPWWTLSLIVCLLCWNNAVHSTLTRSFTRSARRVPGAARNVHGST